MFPVDEKFSQIYIYQAFIELAKLNSGGDKPGGRSREERPILEVRLARCAKRGVVCLLLWIADILIRTGNWLKEACYLPYHGLAK